MMAQIEQVPCATTSSAMSLPVNKIGGMSGFTRSLAALDKAKAVPVTPEPKGDFNGWLARRAHATPPQKEAAPRLQGYSEHALHATSVLVIETTKAIKLSDITNPPNSAGTPASFKILIVFFLYVTAKKTIRAITKKTDLNNNICQTLASSNDLITNPPQLKQNPPNKRSIYPGILYRNCI